MNLVVHKYGGSSLATPAHIRRAAERIGLTHSQGQPMVVVVSAMGKTTDHLIRLSQKTVTKPSPRELDMLLTTGERVSMSLLAMALESLGVPAISFTGSQSGIVTDGNHTDARILEIRPHRIRAELERNKVVIIAGFQGVSQNKEITTLGRGGSDTTAVALAAALSAQECVIFTDVNGLFTADPRVVSGTHVIPRLHYDEALEMASLGAKMHPRSIELAQRQRVKLFIRSSFNDEGPGTFISDGERMGNGMIRGVPTQPQFDSWPNHIQTTFSESNAIDKTAVGLVSVVGNGISATPSILQIFLKELSEFEILFVSSNSLSISAALRAQDLKRAAQKLHDVMVGPLLIAGEEGKTDEKISFETGKVNLKTEI